MSDKDGTDGAVVTAAFVQVEEVPNVSSLDTETAAVMASGDMSGPPHQKTQAHTDLQASNSDVHNHAWTLLSLKSAPASPTSSYTRLCGGAQQMQQQPGRPIARLQGRDFDYIMRQKRVVVGRQSGPLGDIDINMGHSSFVSRRHLEVFYENSRFFVKCEGKNGIFVDDVFQRREAPPLQLPSTCCLRFPSTQVKIKFEALFDDDDPPSAIPSRPTTPKKHQTTPLNINTDFTSPIPSPTGTLSAANSCPASPRSGSRVGNMPDIVFAAQQAANITSPTPARPKSVIPSVSPSHPVMPHTGIFDCGQTTVPAAESNVTITVVTESDGMLQEEQRRQSSKASKPPYSYAQLIIQAISSTREHQLTLSGIYSYIMKNYSFYMNSDKGWQNSIRHNLSLNRYFVKVPRSQDEPGKGCFWRVEAASETKLIEQAFKKRRTRGVPCFRAPFASSNVTRSAPPSPSHSPHTVIRRSTENIVGNTETFSPNVLHNGVQLQFHGGRNTLKYQPGTPMVPIVRPGASTQPRLQTVTVAQNPQATRIIQTVAASTLANSAAAAGQVQYIISTTAGGGQVHAAPTSCQGIPRGALQLIPGSQVRLVPSSRIILPISGNLSTVTSGAGLRLASVPTATVVRKTIAEGCRPITIVGGGSGLQHRPGILRGVEPVRVQQSSTVGAPGPGAAGGRTMAVPVISVPAVAAVQTVRSSIPADSAVSPAFKQEEIKAHEVTLNSAAAIHHDDDPGLPPTKMAKVEVQPVEGEEDICMNIENGHTDSVV